MDSSHLHAFWNRGLAFQARARRALQDREGIRKDILALIQGVLAVVGSAIIALGAWKSSKDSVRQEWLERSCPSPETWAMALAPSGIKTVVNEKLYARLLKSLPQRGGIRGAVYVDGHSQTLAIIGQDALTVAFHQMEYSQAGQWEFLGMGWPALDLALEKVNAWKKERQLRPKDRQSRPKPRDPRLLIY